MKIALFYDSGSITMADLTKQTLEEKLPYAFEGWFNPEDLDYPSTEECLRKEFSEQMPDMLLFFISTAWSESEKEIRKFIEDKNRILPDCPVVWVVDVATSDEQLDDILKSCANSQTIDPGENPNLSSNQEIWKNFINQIERILAKIEDK